MPDHAIRSTDEYDFDPLRLAMNHRLISNLCWITSGLGIAGALLWIALAEEKGTAMLGALGAVALARILIGEVARRHEERDIENHERDGREPPETGTGADNG